MSTTVEDVISEPPYALAAHHPLGISTGVFVSARGSWAELAAEARTTSTFAVEFSALSGDELPGLIAYFRTNPRLPFRYVSVHAPAKSLEQHEAVTIAMLAGLPLWVRSIVAHPDVVVEASRYRALGSRLALENMDGRKRAGRTADELERLFDELPEAGFCLDIAHAHAIDETMDAAHELLNRFRPRLRQVHLSSLEDGHHIPLALEDERQFFEVLSRCRDVPWILEALPPSRWAGQLEAPRRPQPAAAGRYA